MAKIERVVVIILILAALAGVTLSYYSRKTRGRIEIIPAELASQAERAKDIIAERRIININTADKQTLAGLPGIGPHLAQRIIDYRRESGGFSSPEEILNIKGIGPKKYESIKEHIRVDE